MDVGPVMQWALEVGIWKGLSTRGQVVLEEGYQRNLSIQVRLDKVKRWRAPAGVCLGCFMLTSQGKSKSS